MQLLQIHTHFFEYGFINRKPIYSISQIDRFIQYSTVDLEIIQSSKPRLKSGSINLEYALNLRIYIYINV